MVYFQSFIQRPKKEVGFTVGYRWTYAGLAGEGRPDPLLLRELVDLVGGAHVLDGEASRLEEGDLVGAGAAFFVACDDLPELCVDVVLCDDTLVFGDLEVSHHEGLGDEVDHELVASRDDAGH